MVQQQLWIILLTHPGLTSWISLVHVELARRRAVLLVQVSVDVGQYADVWQEREALGAAGFIDWRSEQNGGSSG